MYIPQTNSTNTYLKDHPLVDDVWTDFQTAGRGQLGNGWESEQGKNVLLSVRLRPTHVPASKQWQVCEQVSLALWQVVTPLVNDPKLLTIKWPNDLYYGDKKLAGMLIEHTLCGQYISESIVGIGLNVNQTKWLSAAPNPISIRLITNDENSVDILVEQLIARLRDIDFALPQSDIYQQHLYRRNGFYLWEEREVNLSPTMNGIRTDLSFEAEIVGVTPQGELVLHTRSGEEKIYHFKQIKYIL